MRRIRAQRSTTWYFADYCGDDALALCSMGAQGFWVRLLKLASEHDGLILVQGRKPTADMLAQACRVRPEELPCVAGWIGEIISNGVCDMTSDDHAVGSGVMINRRIQRAGAEHEQAVEDGRKGGNPALLGGHDNALDLLDGAARDAVRREGAKERNRKYRQRQRDAKRDARDAERDALSVTRDVTETRHAASRERHAVSETPSAPTDCETRDGVNPRLKPHTSPFLSIRESSPALPSSTSGDRPSRRRAAGPPDVAGKAAAPPMNKPPDDDDRAARMAQLAAFAADEAPTTDPAAHLATTKPAGTA